MRKVVRVGFAPYAASSSISTSLRNTTHTVSDPNTRYLQRCAKQNKWVDGWVITPQFPWSSTNPSTCQETYSQYLIHTSYKGQCAQRKGVWVWEHLDLPHHPHTRVSIVQRVNINPIKSTQQANTAGTTPMEALCDILAIDLKARYG
jgi:hypothetical protein